MSVVKARQEVLTWVAVPDDGVPGRTVTWHATREPVRLDGMSNVVSPELILALCHETLSRHRISRTAQLLPEILSDRCCTRCVVTSTADADDKKKLAEQLEQFGNQQRDFVVNSIQQMLRMTADSVMQIVRPYEHDEWAREWVDLAKRAAADLRLAEVKVQIQPLAPHGKVPS